jgi:TolB protein
MWQRKRQVIGSIGGLLIVGSLVLGALLLVLEDECCALPPVHGQNDPFELTGKLVFVSDLDYTGYFGSIATLNADGTDFQTLTHYFDEGELQRYRVNSPSWSADGEQIVFVATKTGESNRLYHMNADGSDMTIAVESETGSYSSPSFSPTGEQVVYGFKDGGDIELYILDLGTQEALQITDNEFEDSSPAWSPDGEWIVFNRDFEGDFELFLMKPDGSEIRQLTNNDARDVYPAWSPDGTQIAFVSDRDGDDGIYVMTIEDQETTHISIVERMFPGRMAWSPDGEFIAYAALVPQENVDPNVIIHPTTALYVVRIGDNVLQLLPFGFSGWNANVSWVD